MCLVAVLRTLDLILSMKIYLLELSGSFNADLNTTGPKQSIRKKGGVGKGEKEEGGSREAGPAGKRRA